MISCQVDGFVFVTRAAPRRIVLRLCSRRRIIAQGCYIVHLEWAVSGAARGGNQNADARERIPNHAFVRFCVRVGLCPVGVGYISAMFHVRVLCIPCSDGHLLAALLVWPQDAYAMSYSPLLRLHSKTSTLFSNLKWNRSCHGYLTRSI